MMQNRERQREREQRRSAEHRADTDLLTAEPFKVSDTLSQFHPYKNEILSVVKILNNIGANCFIIAAALGLQGWKTFYGDCEWTEAEVKGLLEGYRAQRKAL